MSADTEIQARVQRGIAFLEEQVGQGWKSLIDVEALDMQMPGSCILGQVFARHASQSSGFSGFGYVRDNLLTGIDDAIDHGFDRLDSATETYGDLQEAWECVLAEAERGQL